MKIVIWNDQSRRGEEIKNGLMQNGLESYYPTVIVACNYVDFAQGVGTDFSDKVAREDFFSNNLLITDLALAEGDNAIEQARPFRDLMSIVFPNHLERIFIFSVLANDPDVVGAAYLNKLNKFASTNVQKLAGHVLKLLNRPT